MIFVNFKTYEQGTGANALSLILIMEEVAHATQVKIIPVLQATDIKEAATASTLEIWVQKIDPVSYGASTGAVLAEAVVEDGAVGTFLNHSEARLSGIDELKVVKQRADQVGLKTLIFAADIQELTEVLALKPTFVAYEPPELIGSKDASVANSYPEVIGKAVEAARGERIPLIVGAGIHSTKDVKKSIELGVVGVAVSSFVVTSQDPKRSLLELTEGFR